MHRILDEIQIESAIEADLPEILHLQKAAYEKEARRHGDYSIQPLRQTLDEVKHEFATSFFLRARLAERIVGSVRARVDGATCRIGKLMVLPEVHRNGIGRRLLKTIESEMLRTYPEIRRFELFTAESSMDNVQLYESEGYVRLLGGLVDSGVKLVHLEKTVGPTRTGEVL